MGLEKVTNPGDVQISQKQYSSSIPVKIIKPSKPAYDKYSINNFEERLSKLLEPQKAIDEKKKLSKFPLARINQEAKQQQIKEKLEEEYQNIKEETRKVEVNKLIRIISFNEGWQQKGLEDHRKNMEIKNKREQQDRKFKAQQTKKLASTIELKTKNIKQDIVGGIQDFEDVLRKKGYKVNQTDSDSEQEESQAPVKKEVSIERRKNDFTQKEKDKRRRKMIVEQNKIQKKIEVHNREQLILSKLKQQSKQEKEIEYEIWRVYQCKKIIQQNREIRDERYKQKEEKTVQKMKDKEEQMLKTLQNEFQNDIESKLNRKKQLEIQSKQDQRKGNYIFCEELSKQLLSLTELLYQQQQKIDSAQIQPEYFNEQVQLFIENQPLIQQKQTRHFDFIKQLKALDSQDLEQKNVLNLKEHQLYQSGQGRWTPEFQVNNTGTIIENDKYIPNEPANNYYLGNLIRDIIEKNQILTITNINSEQNEQIQDQSLEISKFINFKGCILGYEFSGKKSASQFIQEKYGFEILQIDELIDQLINLAKSGQEVEEDCTILIQQTNLGKKIFQQLLDGETLDDRTKIEVLKLKLLELFQYQDQNDFLQNFEDKHPKGFLLVDFPSNYNQAQLIDQELAGFFCEDLKPLTQKQIELQQLEQIIKYTQDKKLPRKLFKGFFDNVYNIQITNTESIRRAVGQRVDTQGQLYHLQDREPSTDISPLNENLNRINSLKHNNMILVDKNNCYDDNIQQLVEWYQNQGQQQEELIEIELETLQDEVVEPEKQEEDKSKARTSPLRNSRHNLNKTKQSINKKEEKEIPEVEDNQQDELKQETQEEQQPQEQNEEPQEEQKQQEIIEVLDQNLNNEMQYIQTYNLIQGIQQQSLIHQEIEQKVELILDIKNKFYHNLKNKEIKDKQIQQQQVKEQQIQEENDKKWLFDEQIKNHLEMFMQNKVQDNDVIRNIYEFWISLYNNYIESNKCFFDHLREQRELIDIYFKDVQLKFISDLQKKDKKFHKMYLYQQNYNNFVETQPDMIEEDDTKCELHQVVEDLHNQIYDLIINHQDFFKEEIVQQKKYQFLEQQLELLTISLINQIQNEFCKSQKSINIINDYYGIEKEFNDNIYLDIQETVKDTQIENLESNLYPRFEKACEIFTKLFEGEYEAEDSKAKKAPPAKKGAATTAKKAGAKIIEEEVKELTEQEKTALAAINTEKAIFRYNLNLLKQFGLQQLQANRLKGNVLFNKLENWLEYYIRVQNQTVNEMSYIFREAIENQSKIQKEIRLEETQVIISSKTLNFFTPDPLILPAREQNFPNRFTISQLYQIIEEIKSFSDDKNQIDLKFLVQLFNRKVINKLNKIQLPTTWLDYDIKNFQALGNNLDPQQTGVVSTRDLSIYLILSNSNIISEQNCLFYKENMEFEARENENPMKIDKSQFVRVDVCFDTDQDNIIEENTNYFERTKYIKEILFYVFQNDDNLIDINQFLETLQAKKYIKTKDNMTYAELLFQN